MRITCPLRADQSAGLGASSAECRLVTPRAPARIAAQDGRAQGWRGGCLRIAWRVLERQRAGRSWRCLEASPEAVALAALAMASICSVAAPWRRGQESAGVGSVAGSALTRRRLLDSAPQRRLYSAPPPGLSSALTGRRRLVSALLGLGAA